MIRPRYNQYHSRYNRYRSRYTPRSAKNDNETPRSAKNDNETLEIRRLQSEVRRLQSEVESLRAGQIRSQEQGQEEIGALRREAKRLRESLSDQERQIVDLVTRLEVCEQNNPAHPVRRYRRHRWDTS